MTLKEFAWQNQGEEIPMQEVKILTGIEQNAADYECERLNNK